MNRSHIIATVVIFFLLTVVARDEYCWMIGCKGLKGYIPTEILVLGKKESVFKGPSLPVVGSEATISDIVHMSETLPTSTDHFDGPWILGRGSVVKVLKYVDEEKKIVHIEVLNDDLK